MVGGGGGGYTNYTLIALGLSRLIQLKPMIELRFFERFQAFLRGFGPWYEHYLDGCYFMLFSMLLLRLHLTLLNDFLSTYLTYWSCFFFFHTWNLAVSLWRIFWIVRFVLVTVNSMSDKQPEGKEWLNVRESFLCLRASNLHQSPSPTMVNLHIKVETCRLYNNTELTYDLKCTFEIEAWFSGTIYYIIN